MKFPKLIYLIFSAILLFYVALPNPKFPEPPPGSIVSQEPADTENPLRKGYYSDLSRNQVLDYYQGKMKNSSLLNLPLPSYPLNYPPEEAQTLIRDQTKSTFLEEIVHPFRESLFINGFEPSDPQNIIEINGKVWKQKLIIKSVGSIPFIRLTITTLSLVLFWTVVSKWVLAVKALVTKNHG